MLDKPTETFEERKEKLIQPFSYEKEKSKTGGVENVELKHTEKFLSPDDPFGHMFKDFGKSSAELRQVMEQNAFFLLNGIFLQKKTYEANFGHEPLGDITKITEYYYR